LASYYASTDVFVAPSIEAEGGDKEGLPVTLMEAMAAGAMVIASDLAGNRDLVQNGHNGFLCRQKDAKDLAEKIVHVLSMDSRTEIKTAARQSILENFDWSVIGEKYTDLLRECLNETSQLPS
jgi:glycosyltransferase involved in cell wall biosynthesis